MGVLGLAILVLSVIFLAYQIPIMLPHGIKSWLGYAGDQTSQKDRTNASPAKQSDGGSHQAESVDNESTPTVSSLNDANEVPALTLDDTESSGQLGSNTSIASTPSNRTLSALSASRPMQPVDAGLMPPPARPSLSRPSAANGLRVPSTGPLPNRGPPANSQQRVQSGLSPNGAVATPSARGKVLLSPGHSPMDWAALTRSGNLSGVDHFQRVTPSRLRQMTGRKGKPAWSSWQGKVYNITPYLPFHPGGEAELMKAAGRDGTKLFMDVHPWVNWENMLNACLVGVLVSEEIASPLESLD